MTNWYKKEKLHITVQEGDIERAREVLEEGHDPTIPGWMGITALQRAKNRKKLEEVEVYELLNEIQK